MRHQLAYIYISVDCPWTLPGARTGTGPQRTAEVSAAITSDPLPLTITSTTPYAITQKARGARARPRAYTDSGVLTIMARAVPRLYRRCVDRIPGRVLHTVRYYI